jgi:LysR family transcriptional regulator of beta-lactamase
MRANYGALKAFEAAARLSSLTRAAEELCVTQAAVGHQVRALERQLGVALFRRLPRGLTPTDEALALLPIVQDAFERIEKVLACVATGGAREVVAIGAVGTFAANWLLPRLSGFAEENPLIEVRVTTHNNRVDIAAEGLDLAIRYGSGAWPGLESTFLIDAPVAPLCSAALAMRLQRPHDLHGVPLFRSYFVDDWRLWFEAAGAPCPTMITGPIFDSSLAMAQCAAQGLGVALAPPVMFARELAEGRLAQPFAVLLPTGAYWLTRLQFRPATRGARALASWLSNECA